MKKIITVLSLVFCLHAKAQTIPNAGFENWVTDTESPQNYLVPQNWLSIDVFVNSISSTYTGTTVSQTTQSHSGLYAVLLQNYIGGGDTVGGELFSCNTLANLGGTFGYYGFPYGLRPAAFQGYYKLTSVGGDIGAVRLTLSKWNTVTNSRDILFQNYFYAFSPASSYTQFNLPITYAFNEFPDTASIDAVMASSGSHTHIGTQFYLDDLSFSGSVALGIEQIAGSNNQVSVYPNPSNGSFVIEPNNEAKQTMQVYDVNGKLVLSQTINGKTTIDASSLNEGVYNISLQSNEGVVNKRLVIVR